MRREDFQPHCPGSFELTTFTEPREPRVTHQGYAFVPAGLPPAVDRTILTGKLYDVLERAQAALLRLDMRIDGLPSKIALLGAMRTREVRASSKIENTFASARDVAIAAASETPPQPMALEVHRNRMAVEWGLRSKYPISITLVRQMHEVLIADPAKRPGEFRPEQACIGDEDKGFSHARFVPPPPGRIEELMRGWERFCNPTPEDLARANWLPYWINLALAHYQFETIHPFRDGNGRLGRALVTLAPIKDRKLKHPVSNLSEWVQSRRQDYYDRLLRVSTHADWESWFRFFLTALAEQAEADMGRAEKLNTLYTQCLAKLQTRKASSLQTKLLDHIFGGRGVTVRIAAKVMGLTYTAATPHVDRFVRMGILAPLDDSKYDRIFVPESVLKIIQGKGED